MLLSVHLLLFFDRTIVLVDSVPAGHTIQGPVYLPTGGSISGGSETGILRGKVGQDKHTKRKTTAESMNFSSGQLQTSKLKKKNSS